MKVPTWLESLIKDHWKKLLTASIPLLGFFLSPLRTIVYQKLWPEGADIAVSINPRSLREGDVFTARVTISPLKHRQVSDGTLTLKYDEAEIKLEDGEDFKKVEASKDESIEDFHFVALSPGEFSVTAILSTEQNAYKSSTGQVVRARDSGGKPSFSNLTGTWDFQIPAAQGELHLIQQGKDLTGEFNLEPNQAGAVKGFRDGCVFYVQLYPSDGSARTVLAGNVGQIMHFLKIAGHASRLAKPAFDQPKPVGDFSGSAQASTDENTPDCIKG